MPEYILLMHDDAISNDDAWGPYIQKLQQGGFFEGGSAIGDGDCARKSGDPASVTAHLTGYIRVNADSIDQAKSLLTGNPHILQAAHYRVHGPAQYGTTDVATRCAMGDDKPAVGDACRELA